MFVLLGKTRVNRALEGSKNALKTRLFRDPHFGGILDDLGLDLPGKTRCFLHAHANIPGFLRVLGDPGSIWGSVLEPIFVK